MNNKKILFVIILFTFFVFSPTLFTYFSQDDWVFLSHVYKQPFLSVIKHYPEAFYRPVGQQLFFFLGGRLFGLESQGFHLIGLAIHLLNILLLSKLMNIWNSDRRLKYFLLTFYAVNPVHFVALNWLTQTDLEIAVTFSLLTVLFWKRTIFSLGLFLAALLSHETVVMLPIAMAIWRFKGPTLPRQGRTLLKPAMFFCFGILVLIIKYLINPFSPQSDYSLSFDPFGFLATLKWYALRAFMIPEGIRNLTVWLIPLSLIPGLILILMFRQKLVRGLGIYLLGVLPVLGFGGHLLAAYAIFGIALMVIELGRISVIPGLTRNLFKWIPTFAGMTVFLGITVVWLVAAGFIYSNYLNHWSTGRGIVSRQLTEEYVRADLNEKSEILTRSKDFINNPEIYFSAMAGKQFEVLDRGIGRGLFDVLFYRGNDMTTQFLPDAQFFKDSILAGKFPLWNPWIFAGMPYLLDPQNFLWYPPNYILLLLPPELGFLILLIGHVLFAGYFLKKLLTKFPAWIQWCGIFFYLLSPKLISHIEEGNWTLVIAACWLPMLYWALKNKRFNWTAISLSAIIINNLNIGYYSVLLVLLYFLTHLNQERSLLAQARRLLKILIATAALTIPRWLPLGLFGNQTVRAGLNEQPLPFWSWTKIIKSLFFPLAGGHPVLQNEEILYFGILPLILGIIFIYIFIYQKGVSLPKQGDSLTRFWIVWLAFIIVVVLNLKTPLFSLIQLLPGFSLLRITTRPWIFISFFVALVVPTTLASISRKSKILGTLGVLGILGEFGIFGYKIFARRVVPVDPLPFRFYQEVAKNGMPVRAYCTTGCLDRLTAQNMGIALLGGNNPIQLTEFVRYLEKAGGYREPAYHPVLPPYTVFSSEPQPDAALLGETSTRFVVSPYELTDGYFSQIDREGAYRLYENKADIMQYRDHYFSLAVSK